MATILTDTLTTETIKEIINRDLQEMYNPEITVEQAVKDKVKAEAEKLSADFVDFVKYHLNNKDTYDDEGYTENIIRRFEAIKTKLNEVLNQNKNDKVVYTSVAGIWVGMFTELERDAKELNDQLFQDIVLRAQIDFLKMVNAFLTRMKIK